MFNLTSQNVTQARDVMRANCSVPTCVGMVLALFTILLFVPEPSNDQLINAIYLPLIFGSMYLFCFITWLFASPEQVRAEIATWND